jgi:hypothetical protein
MTATILGEAWSATIDLSDTDLTFDQAYSAQGWIAARFGLPATSVMVVPHESGRNDLATLMVFEHNPLQQVQLFRGPTLDLETGRAIVGIHTDGKPAFWQFFRPGYGAFHGLIFGTTGSGKSGLVHTLIAESSHSGVIAPIIADGKGGLSFPDYQEHVSAFAGTVPRTWTMLCGVEAMLDKRKRDRARVVWIDSDGRRRRGLANFTPTPADPILWVLVDELPVIAQDPLFGKDCVRILARIAKEGRQFGIGVTYVQQTPSLEESGDAKGASALRGMAASMNIAAFRTGDQVDKQMGLPMKLPIDPASLPERWPDGSTTAGLGFLARTDSPTMTMRGLHQEDPYHWASTGRPAPIPPNLLTVAGPLFGSWRDLIDIDDDTVVAVLPDGRLLRAGESVKEAAKAGPPEPKPAASTGTAWEVLSAKLYANYPQGATTKTLEAATGLARNTIGNALNRAAERGEAHRLTGNVWKLGPAPAELVKSA